MRLASLTFITRVGFSTSTLARTLDSLVRVSRRVGKDHFDRIAQSTLRRSSYRDPWSDFRSRPAPQTLCSYSTSSGLTKGYYCSASTSTPCPPLTYVQRQSLGRTFIASCRIHLYRFLLNGFRSFDSLSKVLFIFPSQYLFAIGFPHIFSLRRSLSPA